MTIVVPSARDLEKNAPYRKNKSATATIIKIVVPRPPEIQNTPGGHLLRPDLPRAILYITRTY